MVIIARVACFLLNGHALTLRRVLASLAERGIHAVDMLALMGARATTLLATTMGLVGVDRHQAERSRAARRACPRRVLVAADAALRDWAPFRWHWDVELVVDRAQGHEWVSITIRRGARCAGVRSSGSQSVVKPTRGHSE